MNICDRPKTRVDVVLDTDAYNEIDDQFAIAWLLLSPQRAHVRALYAAPFFNGHSTSPADGMERSYAEILHLLELMGRRDMTEYTYRGSPGYLPDERTPIDSPAARHLAALAAQYSPEHPLYVIAIGAITNVASALLMAPEIAKNLVIVWLGGHAQHWPDTQEFNMMQDVAAARVVFDSAAALVQLPCMGVVDHLTTTAPELNFWLRGKNALCDYLCDHTIEEAEAYAKGTPWSRVIWDVSAVAWLLDSDSTWIKDQVCPRPVPGYDHQYTYNDSRPLMRYVYAVDRDAIFGDLFAHLAGCMEGRA